MPKPKVIIIMVALDAVKLEFVATNKYYKARAERSSEYLLDYCRNDY